MNNNKYELTTNFVEINGKKLYQIKAIRDFNSVKIGDLEECFGFDSENLGGG